MSLSTEEDKILESINVPSENNPQKPVFPPADPKWPSTPIKNIEVPGFHDVWIKDESVNPTGTHKDRMAWEMVMTYRQLLLAKKGGRIEKLPQMSIISSGSAANAVQHMLRKHNLPNLKVLIDFNLNTEVKRALEDIGCEIYETDLSKKALSTEEILKLTNNVEGIDITSDDSLEPFTVFYDWMSYDIINQNADYVFVPYGTGNLYENLVNVAVRESKNIFFHDKRFKGDAKRIRKCNFLGATSSNPKTKADKLYSPYLPFIHFDKNWINLAVKKGDIGPESNVYAIREEYLEKAASIAKQNKIDCEPSGIAGLALLLQMRKKIPKEKKILIINTGKTKY